MHVAALGVLRARAEGLMIITFISPGVMDFSGKKFL